MKFFLKSLIGVGCLSLAIFKFYPSLIGEPIDVEKFSDFYVSETVESEEENGGIELLTSNFYSVEREYKIIKEEEKTTEIVEKTEVEEFKTPQKEIYTVKSGDTLSGIAEKYNIDLEILQANNPKLSKTLKIGDEINIITENGIFYEVKKGDSLYRIASKYKVKIDELKKYNNEYANNLKPGQEIFIKDPDLSVVNRVILAKKTRPVETTVKTAKVSQSKTKKSVTSSLAKYSFNMPVKWTGVSSPFG
ncbi:MAG: LysM peptidoglycan-binding domain-containing protein, partial [Cetobacterium sp.]